MHELRRSYAEDLDVFEGRWSRGLFVAGLAALVAWVLLGASGSPLAWLGASSFTAYLLTKVALFVTAAIGLNLLVGYTGQISMGHAAFLAIGAYVHVILYARGALLPVGLVAAALVSGALGGLVGIPALRLRGPYLAIATLGFQVSVDQVLGRWDSVTGGRMGLGVPLPSIAGREIGDIRIWFCVCLGVAVLVGLGTYNLARSRVGRAFVALRDNDVAAQAMGVDLVRYKTLAFALSAGVTGLAGALYAHLVDRLNPASFSLLLSIELLVMVLVGGLGSVLGSVLGATLLVLLPRGLSALHESLAAGAAPEGGGVLSVLATVVDESHQSIVVGAILILVLLFEPMGLRGRWLRIKVYFRAWPF